MRNERSVVRLLCGCLLRNKSCSQGCIPNFYFLVVFLFSFILSPLKSVTCTTLFSVPLTIPSVGSFINDRFRICQQHWSSRLFQKERKKGRNNETHKQNASLHACCFFFGRTANCRNTCHSGECTCRCCVVARFCVGLSIYPLLF